MKKEVQIVGSLEFGSLNKALRVLGRECIPVAGITQGDPRITRGLCRAVLFRHGKGPVQAWIYM